MVIWILFACLAFRSLWISMGAQALVIDLLTALPVSRWVTLFVMFSIIFVLGMFLDPLATILICAPIFLPMALLLEFDHLWFSIMFMSLVSLGYVTPPFGYSLFYVRAVAPEGVTVRDIFVGVVPFILIWLVSVFVATLYPPIVTWLPNLILGAK